MTPRLPFELIECILDSVEIAESYDDHDRTSFLRSASLNAEWRSIARLRLYRNVVLPTPTSAAAFILLLKADPEIAPCVLTLRLGIASGIGSEASEGKWRIATLLKALPNVEQLFVSGLRSVELRDLGHGKGSSKLQLHCSRKLTKFHTGLRSMHLHSSTILNSTSTLLRSLKFPFLSFLSLRHTNLASPVASLLLRPSTLPVLRSLVLQYGSARRSVVDGFRQIAPQLEALSLDISPDDPIQCLVALCPKLSIFDGIPTTNSLRFPLKVLRLNRKTGRNLLVKSEISEVVIAALGLDGVLERLIVPHSWSDVDEETEDLKALLFGRDIEITYESAAEAEGERKLFDTGFQE